MTSEERDALIKLLDELPAADLAALTRFAEFLLHRAGGTRPERATEPVAPAGRDIPEPEPIPRPAGEKVVAAVKRLSRTYYMLDKKQMLGVTSDLVTQHVLQGRDAADVIDELEDLFSQHYRRLRGDENS